MQIKLFELRDRSTMIPIMAIKVDSGNPAHNEAERWLLRTGGYGPEQSCYMMFRIDEDGAPVHFDPYGWPASISTWQPAHLYIEQNWEKLGSGQVICTETIRGERATPKTSDRFFVASLSRQVEGGQGQSQTDQGEQS